MKVECSQCGSDILYGSYSVDEEEIIVVTPCECQIVHLEELQKVVKKIDTISDGLIAIKKEVKGE